MKVDVVVVKRRKKVEVTVARRSCTPSMEHIHYLPSSVQPAKPAAPAASVQEPIHASASDQAEISAPILGFAPEPVEIAPEPVEIHEYKPVSSFDFEAKEPPEISNVTVETDEMRAEELSRQVDDMLSGTYEGKDDIFCDEENFSEDRDCAYEEKLADAEHLVDQDEQPADDAPFNIRFYGRDTDGERIETDQTSACGQEIVCFDSESGKLSRVCGIIRKGAPRDGRPDDEDSGNTPQE